MYRVTCGLLDFRLYLILHLQSTSSTMGICRVRPASLKMGVLNYLIVIWILAQVCVDAALPESCRHRYESCLREGKEEIAEELCLLGKMRCHVVDCNSKIPIRRGNRKVETAKRMLCYTRNGIPYRMWVQWIKSL
ncbi:hypothetical protein ScPMuIL_016958 [Solemya velum]